MIDLSNYQCIENTKAGDSVQYNGKMHRVQDDKGWLFIQVTKEGKRIKIGIDRILMNAGTLQDYIFNGWFEKYSIQEYLSFVVAELNWVN